jgi:hypothetical protein
VSVGNHSGDCPYSALQVTEAPPTEIECGVRQGTGQRESSVADCMCMLHAASSCPLPGCTREARPLGAEGRLQVLHRKSPPHSTAPDIAAVPGISVSC